MEDVFKDSGFPIIFFTSKIHAYLRRTKDNKQYKLYLKNGSWEKTIGFFKKKNEAKIKARKLGIFYIKEYDSWYSTYSRITLVKKERTIKLWDDNIDSRARRARRFRQN